MTAHVIGFVSDPFRALNGIDAAIHDLYGACFDAITSSTHAHISMYMLDGRDKPNVASSPKRLIDRLTAAVTKQGASVDVLFDVDHYSAEAAAQLRTQLTAAGLGAWYPQHKTPHRGLKGTPKLHDKLLLFDTLTFASDAACAPLRDKTVPHVIVLSSANIWHSQYSQANQALLFWGDAALYAYYLAIWKRRKSDMQSKSFHLSNHTPAQLTSGDMTAYAMPRDGNVIADVLTDLLRDTSNDPVHITLAMAYFSHTGIARLLAQLGTRTHTTVKILGRKGAFTQAVLDTLRPHTEVRLIEAAAIDGTTRKLHAKFLLIDSAVTVDGVRKRRKRSWSGALNYTKSGLSTNAETLVRSEDRALFETLARACDALNRANDAER